MSFNEEEYYHEEEDYQEDYSFENENNFHKQKIIPGEKLLKLSPPKNLKATKYTAASICLVEDLGGLFSDLKIEFSRGGLRGEEVLIPTVLGLPIFVPKGISPNFSTPISKNIVNDENLAMKIRSKEWYQKALNEFESALDEYTSCKPLVHIGNTDYPVRTQCQIEIPAGEKCKVITPYRLPCYWNRDLKVIMKPLQEFKLKTTEFTTIFPNNSFNGLENIVIPGFKTSILDWINNLDPSLLDYCYEGLFTELDFEKCLSITILNIGEKPLVIQMGTKVANISIEF